MLQALDAPRVLLVDSDRIRRRGLAHMLLARGYEVLEAATVAASAQLLRQAHAEALVLSSRLADGTALDLVAECSRRPQPFVVVHGEERAAEAPLPEGVDVVLRGPLNEQQVALLLGEVVPVGGRTELDRIRRGEHALLLYRSRPELLDQLAAFFDRGLRTGERCVLACEDEIQIEQARAHFARRGLPVASAERARALLFLNHDESYFVSGRFEPVAMVNLLTDFVATALDEGFSGVRGAGEGSWIPETPEDEEAWFWYENEVNHLFAKGAATGLCMYSVERFTPRQILAALATHPLVIEGRLLFDNPNFGEPNLFGSVAPAEMVLRAKLAAMRSARRLA